MSVLNIHERTLKSYENSKIPLPKHSMAKQLHAATEEGVRTRLAEMAGKQWNKGIQGVGSSTLTLG